MDIITENNGGELTVRVIGRLDTVTAPSLEGTLGERLDGVTALVFDLAEMSYTSSAGLRIFLKAQKRMRTQGTMKLIHVRREIMEILEMTGFTELMTVEP